MEVDDRLRWLESRISSSLKPRGEELRNFFADEENRAAFLAFCNHSESRRIFIHLTSSEDRGEGQIHVGTSPPKTLSDKSLFFLKCSHASKLSRESISEDVVYSECSKVPLDHLELVMKEVYLPLISLQSTTQQRPSSDKLLDLMHRMVGTMQVTKGYSQGKVILPLPSIEVLAEAAMNSDRRAAVIHVLESSVVSWMKQVKMVLHLDCSAAISKIYGKYPGPLAELEVWNKRLASLESVRDQMDSVAVLNILHSLEQAHSTYSQAFIHVHRDIGKAIVDTEHCLVYLNTLQPWFLQLHQSYSPDTLLKLFPPLMTTLSLVWQYSGVYSSGAHFQRVLQLVSNEVMLKARDIVGENLMEQPEMSLVNLKLALRVCAAFRGCYLDYREKSEVVSLKHKERFEAMKLRDDSTQERSRTPSGSHIQSSGQLCAWPPRNSPVFAALSSFMERCNDLLELVQTVQDFRELEAAAYGVDGQCVGQVGDPVIADIYTEFTTCLCQFTQGVQDLLNLDPESPFEEHFFSFRSTVKALERQTVGCLVRAFDSAPSLPARLRVLEMFQGISKRDCIKTDLTAQLEAILSDMTSDVEAVSTLLSTAHPPTLPHTPPTSCKLLWLNALKERVREPMERVREVAPEILEGDSGWKLRQAYSRVTNTIESLMSTTVSDWCESVPPGLQRSLRWNVLTRDSSDRLIVNFDSQLSEVLAEIRHLKRSPLNIRLPSHLSRLAREVDPSELRHRRTSLEVVVQTYNEIRESLSQVEENLFLHKLQQTEQLLCVGLDQLDWTSVTFPDFIAKSKAMVCTDLQSSLTEVHHHTSVIASAVGSWSKVCGLDVFSACEERTELKQLESKNRQVLESLQSCIPPSVQRISTHITNTFQCIDEASQESPAWTAYLRHIDSLALSGLKQMALTVITSLLQRAGQYEQGTAIRPIVTVCLELQATDVQFSPPLSTHSALVSVPEAVQKWIDEYMGLAKLVPRFGGSGEGGTFQEELCGDSELKGAVSKISAHLETNARHCQSLRKRFTIYSFLWEQDVSATFSDFLAGQAPPHPRRFTRPETVRSRASARAHSGRPRSSSLSQSALTTTPESNLLGVMGVSDWDFLRPPSMDSGEDEGKRPSLDDFDGEIAVFQGVLERLSKIEDVADVGWVCVDQRPVKQALSSLASKWKHVYASHLERQVGHVLSGLDQFFEEVEPEVEGISGEESDTQSFMKLMNIFNKVNKQQVEMDTKFGAVHRAVLMLDKFEYPISPTIRNRFNSAPQRWSNLKKRVALGKQRVGPRIQAKGDIISQDLTRFREIFSSLRSEFISSQCVHHDCSREEATSLIGEFSKQLKGLQTQAQDLIELQELLETSIFNFSLLKEFEEELTTLQELWKLSESLHEVHSSWHAQSWTEVDSSDLLTRTEDQLDLLSELPQAVVQGWDLYQHTHRLVTVAQSTVPVLERLKSPSMRPRHWKQVLKFARSSFTHSLMKGGSFDVSLLEELTFGQLLDMELHAQSGEVYAIVERANKDVAIESLLNTFEEVWLSKHFELRLHQRMRDTGGQEGLTELAMETSSNTPKSHAPSTRVTSGVRRVGRGHTSVTLPTTPGHTAQGKIPLLCNTSSIFETLESHQTSLQSLEGTIAAASFADDLQKWHKQLQTIEAVLTVWLQVQLLWVQLEEVYCSSEVTQHLPSEAYTFTTVDCEWRELMGTVARNTAVIAVCLKDGLLLSLEKFHSGLMQCRTALVRYVEAQRVKCPWFHFLPLEDILQFICYGSSLDQLSAHIHKLLPHACGLVFNDDLGPLSVGHTPSHAYTLRGGTHQNRISGVTCSAGERLDLMQGVHCEGPVDMIVSKVMTSVTSTLQSQLNAVLTKYITTSPAHKQTVLESLANLPSLWKSNVSTQIISLATQIALEMVLTKAIQNSAMLNELLAEVGSLSKTATDLLRGKALPDASMVGFPEAPSQSQVNMESNVALKASVSTVGSDVGSGLFDQVAQINRSEIPKHQLIRLQSIQLVLWNYKLKIEQLSSLEPTPSLSEGFEWQSMLHYEWSSREQKSYIRSLNTRLVYGHQYTGSAARIVVTPLMERTMYSMLRAIDSGGALLTGDQGVGRSSLVHELAVMSGRQLFTVRCSPQTNVTSALEAVKGMSATGSWLFLLSLDALTPPALQAVCSLLLKVHQARLTQSTDSVGGCFATLSHGSQQQKLPSTLLEYFQTCSVGTPNRKVILEALFLVSEFATSQKLAQSLDRVCLALDELYSYQTSTSTMKPFHLGLHKLKAIVLLAEKHMKEFEGLGLLSTEGDPPQNEPLKMPSIVYSEVSQSTRASLKFKMGSESTDSQPMTRQLLEEFALVLALKDTLLPALSLESKEHHITVTLISELFPSCDLRGLLAHEGRVREGLALKAQSESEAEESARESRAASALQNVLDENQTSEVSGTLEDQVIQSCQIQQLVPTVGFQTAVSQLVTLVQLNRVVVVSGPSSSGKTSVIRVAADTLTHTSTPLTKSAPVSLTTLAVGALQEEQLLGYQDPVKGTWVDGLLTQCLSSQKGKLTSPWFVLEGPLSPTQLDSLLACETGPHPSLVLTNGRSLPIDPSVRFLLEMISLSSLTPSTAVRVALLKVPGTTVSWQDILTRWHNTQSDSLVRRHRASVQALCDKYLPSTLELLQPALLSHRGRAECAGLSTSTLVSGAGLCRLQSQDLRLSEVHVVQTLCTVLQCVLSSLSCTDEPSSDGLERAFVYALVWSCGGFLTTANKEVFDRRWQDTHNQSNLFPKDGLLWDYHPSQDLSQFSPCATNPVPITSDSHPPFVPTIRSQSYHHLLSLLLKQGSPILLSGRHGSGKTSLLLNCLRKHCQSSETRLLHLYVNQGTCAGSVWGQVESHLEWRWGRRYTPRDSKKLLCFIDDLHNAQDKSASEFIRQHISSGGYHDPITGKAHNMSDMSYVVTAHLDSEQEGTVDSQLLKHFTVLQWDEYSSEQVSTIFGSLLSSKLNSSDLSADLVSRLVSVAEQVHRRVESMFLATPNRLHYLFSMNNIATVFRSLCSVLECGSPEAVDPLTAWQRTSWWVYAGLMSSAVDRERYWEVVSHALRKYFNQHSKLPWLLSEGSARLPGEAVEQSRQRLRHQLEEHNSTHPAIHINLYNTTVEEVTHICQVLSSPHDMGQLLLLGHTHPEPLVQLAALHTGHTFTQPSHLHSSTLISSGSTQGMSPHSYTLESLRKDLVHTYTVAGVKNEKMVLLLSEQELLNEDFLTYVYQFVRGVAISPMFSHEEQSRIVTAVRSDLAQSGLTFTVETAWNFFLSRVRDNVRMVLSLPQLTDKLSSGSAKWRDLLGSLRAYTHLPWDRKELVDVATYHLKGCGFLPSQQSESLAHLLASVHLQLRKRVDTPTSNSTYQYFTERFVHQLRETHVAIETGSSLASSAVECVRTAQTRARGLEERVGKEEIILTEKSEACAKLLVQIGQDTAIMKQHSRLLGRQKERIAHLKKVIPEFEHACDLSLREKAELVTSTQQLALNMDQGGLCELRTLLRPPEEVKELLMAVISVIKGPTADKTWTKGAKRLMANLDRLRELLMEFGACEDNSEVVLEALDPLMQKPTFTPNHFTQHTSGQAASQLCSWIRGVHSLHSTLQSKIRPLQSKMSTMQASLTEYTDRLKVQENKIRVLEERLAGLGMALENASVEKSRQRELVRSMQRECQQTNKFIETLSPVHEVWLSQSTDVMAALSRSIGSCCLSLCVAVYLSSLPPHTQLEVINNQVIPVMTHERGVELVWPENNRYLSAFVTERDVPVATPAGAVATPPGKDNSAEGQSCDVSHVLSYSALSKCLVSTLVPPSFSDHWIGECGSLPQLLSFSLVESSWRRWPLVHDPHGMARQWVRTLVGEPLIILDGSDRSCKFYQRLEEGLVGGGCVLVEQFPCSPPDPSLHPLLYLRHSWKEGVNIVQLCGHRLHVHPSFKLYLTTPTPLMSLPSSLGDLVTLISCDVSQPVAVDMLMNTALSTLGGPEASEEVKRSCVGVASCKAQLEELDRQLFNQLPCPGREPVYRACTEKFSVSVARKNEICSELEAHFSNLYQQFVGKSHLRPLVQHAAMAHTLLQDCAESAPHSSQSWSSFTEVFKSSLDDHHGLLSTGSGQRVKEAMHSFNKYLLQDTFRYLNHQQWNGLAVSLSLLSLSHPTPSNVLLLMDQLEYLAHSQSYLEEAELSVDLPPNPTCITVELWQTLHKLPLPVEYFRALVNSTHTHSEFWEGLSTEPHKHLQVTDFPWHSDEVNSSVTGQGEANLPLTGLEDQVVLRCISEGSSMRALSELVTSLVDCVGVVELREVCESGLRSKRPLLFYHDQQSQVSQINRSSLEITLKAALKDKRLSVVRMGAGMVGVVSDLLTRPTSDCLLIEDLQYSPPTWLELLYQHSTKAVATGCQLVFTVSLDCPDLPRQFVRSCHTSLLSKLAPVSSLPKTIGLTGPLSHKQLLRVCLASIPKELVSNISSKVKPRSKTLVYSLTLLHVAVSKFVTGQSRLLPCSFTNLLRCLSVLVTMETDTVASLEHTVREVYSGCVPGDELDRLVSLCLSEEGREPGARVVLGEEEFTVPGLGVDPARYGDHVPEDTGDESSHISWDSISGGIEAFLLPLLSRLPSHTPTLPSTPLSPSHPSPTHATRSLVASLDYCRESLPPCIDDRGTSNSVMSVCSQLLSNESYSHFRTEQLCESFNEKILTIRNHDIPTLAHYSHVEFDSLPSSLHPTLLAIQQGVWPQNWRLHPSSEHLSLAEGIQELMDVHERLSSSVT